MTVRDLKKADLRFHTNPLDLAQAIAASAQATVTEVAGTAATQVGRVGTTAAAKTTELAETAASEISKATGKATTKVGDLTGTAASEISKATGKATTKVGDLTGTAASEISKATGIAVARLSDHSRTFHQSCQDSLESFRQMPSKRGADADASVRAAAAAAWERF